MSQGRTGADAAALAAKVAQYQWHHSLDLGDGVVTPGSKSLQEIALEKAAFFDRVDFRGRSVVDIGAWHGTFSFEAKRRGASRVLATDHLAWIYPTVRGRETFDLAKERLGMDVEALQIDVVDTTADRIGQFDIVLFLGVLYHLPDPFRGLANVAGLTRELLIIETTLDLSNLTDPALRHCPGAQWSPNALCMVRLLQAAGFADIEALWHPYAHNRGIFFAWRLPAARKAAPNAIDVIDLAPNVLSRAASKLSDGRIGYHWRKLRKAMNGSTQPGGAS